MREPTNLMRKLAARLFPESEEEQGAFLEALVRPEEARQSAVIWTRPELREESDLDELEGGAVPPWNPEAVSWLAPGTEPGKSPLFEKGAFYPMDVSSVITASAMLEVPQPRRVLDVCAAPGGKTLFAAVVLRSRFLLANEVVGKRLGILRHNLKRSGCSALFTQSLHPGELAGMGEDGFELVIVDAPCSGQSLLVKGKDNPGCFHPNIVNGNARRQRSILSASASCVAPGGFLFYSTCTFAPKENEGVVEKFLSRNPEFEAVAVSHLEEWRSTLAECPAYRIYPHRRKGAGGFVCLLRRGGAGESLPPLPAELTRFPVGDA